MMGKVKSNLLVVLVFTCLAASCSESSLTNSFNINTSIVSLISDPAKFDGEYIRISGYVEIEPESSVMYLSKGDATHYNLANAVWLDLSGMDTNISSEKLPTKEWAIVEGYFNDKHTGHLGLYFGAMVDIKRIEKIKQFDRN